MSLQDYLLAHYTADTAKIYGIEINSYIASYAGANTAVYKDVVHYIGALRSRYSNPSTLNRILCSIKVYYDYLCSENIRNDNPAKAIRLRDQRNRDIQLQDLFTTDELEVLLHRKERYGNLDYRNKVLISLLVYQGLHPAEMEALTTADINLEAGTIYIRATPKTSGRELSLRPNQILLFYHYIHEIRPKLLNGNDCNVLLIGLRGEPMKGEDITKHVKRIYNGLYPGRKVNAQTIGQSVIANLLKQGHDLSVVQGFAGHKYPSATQQYRQNEVETLQAAVNKYHSFG
jgi:site-specific recombinase XerD